MVGRPTARGTKAGGGKKAGLNKLSGKVVELLQSLGCSPIEILAAVAKGELVDSAPGKKEGTEAVKIIPTLDQRMAAAKVLLEYVAPKLKTIEHEGDVSSHVSGGITIIIQKGLGDEQDHPAQ